MYRTWRRADEVKTCGESSIDVCHSENCSRTVDQRNRCSGFFEKQLNTTSTIRSTEPNLPHQVQQQQFSKRLEHIYETPRFPDDDLPAPPPSQTNQQHVMQDCSNNQNIPHCETTPSSDQTDAYFVLDDRLTNKQR